MFTYQLDNFKIVEFYPYPSYIQYEIASYDDWAKRGDMTIKKFFERVLEKAEELTGYILRDNKIAFKIIHKPTGTTLYVGYKDNNYRIGMGVWSEFPSEVRKIEEDTKIPELVSC